MHYILNSLAMSLLYVVKVLKFTFQQDKFGAAQIERTEYLTFVKLNIKSFNLVAGK